MEDELEVLFSGQQYKKLQEFIYKPILNQYGLNVLDLRVLLFLQEHEECHTARDIIEIHHLTKSYVSKSVETLIEKGYLQRNQDSSDRRCMRLELLKQAFPVIEATKEQRQQMLEIMFKGVSREEISTVCSVAMKISENIAVSLKTGRGN